MQIVIELTDKEKEMVDNSYKAVFLNVYSMMANKIKNGKILPKGHGDLVDVNDLSLMTVHLIDGVFLCDAPTIIEADKEE